MNSTEARQIIAVLQAHFGAHQIPESTVQVWSAALLECEAIDAAEAVKVLGATWTPTFANPWPPLDVLLETIHDERGIRVAKRALPASTTHACDRAAPSWCGEPGHCCWHLPCGGAPVSFGEWYRSLATDREKAIVAKVGPAVFERLESA